MCRWLLAIHRLQAAAFGDGLSQAACKALSPNSYQEILLDLYLAALEDRQIYQSCLAGAGPPASAHRQAVRLEALGAVSRSLDDEDHRRVNVVLTPQIETILDAFLDAVDQRANEHFPKDE